MALRPDIVNLFQRTFDNVKYFVSSKNDDTTESHIRITSTTTVTNPSTKLYFKECKDKEYVIEAMSGKVMLDMCENTRFTFDGKIVTNVMEIFNGNNLDVKLPRCHAQFRRPRPLPLRRLGQGRATGRPVLDTATLPSLTPSTTQYVVRLTNETLVSEPLERNNGFPVVSRAAAETAGDQDDAEAAGGTSENWQTLGR
ncbi:hypothetical protein BC938DRAFT_470539 [Jimgerdemannia flammicorona]|uniref:Adenylate cyclase-associated CAP C-terminal domain-containing protein n=1 Tax=Jimgerdemannia flammicorona TaxID=994334 RepID=A0A433Q9Y9_9FUNG|nr:hypothetical protein BC938DRAFT_470539 [Jimgerdemannia flammicorona]